MLASFSFERINTFSYCSVLVNGSSLCKSSSEGLAPQIPPSGWNWKNTTFIWSTIMPLYRLQPRSSVNTQDVSGTGQVGDISSFLTLTNTCFEQYIGTSTKIYRLSIHKNASHVS